MRLVFFCMRPLRSSSYCCCDVSYRVTLLLCDFSTAYDEHLYDVQQPSAHTNALQVHTHTQRRNTIVVLIVAANTRFCVCVCVCATRTAVGRPIGCRAMFHLRRCCCLLVAEWPDVSYEDLNVHFVGAKALVCASVRVQIASIFALFCVSLRAGYSWRWPVACDAYDRRVRLLVRAAPCSSCASWSLSQWRCLSLAASRTA